MISPFSLRASAVSTVSLNVKLFAMIPCDKPLTSDVTPEYSCWKFCHNIMFPLIKSLFFNIYIDIGADVNIW